jgi:WD40 repeat protein
MAEAVNFDKATLAWTLPWDADWVTAVTFIGSTRRFAAGNNLGQILVWELPEKPGGAAPSPVRRLDGHTNGITKLFATPDGKCLISASYDHTISYWNMDAASTDTDTDTVILNATAIADASSPAGKRAGKKIPPAVEAKVDVQKAERTLKGHDDWILGLALSRDAKLLVSGGDDENVIVWDRPAGKELRRWKLTSWTYALALSPDAKQALISERNPLYYDPTKHAAVKLWDAAAGKVERDLSADYKDVQIAAAAYSPDGKILALGRGGEVDGNSGKVFLIDPATGKKARELTPGHQYGITDLVFHPDGQHLASSGRDTVVRLWRLSDGKLIKELGKPRGGQFKDWIHAISLSADGRWLGAADMAGQAQVWAFLE